ncbi:nuclear transport factor 2 family protein [Flavihumibacter fluvii]|uniref:nuclear transport factor 2 family protein n=1 Tax=Flavihumibacter fluvii TaxID=2838157 RepID=UPI001BDF0E56|nr:nuclear transport factor 2 family protein [Flavihumibacter fluvii]ULQ51526.1 nuclear transport factor 2 family protein [Flavihumibacter fluvii]
MSLTLQQIAEFFSGGQFAKIYQHFSDNIIWNVVGENSFVGKKAVVDNCEQVAAYFQAVTTNFKIDNVIVDNNRVAIDGTAEFSRDGKRVSYVWACDVYEFNDRKELEKITSYCIQEKK